MGKETNLTELGEMLTHVVKHMATKEDIDEVRQTLNEHTDILNEHTAILKEHTIILKEHSETLADHTRQLNIVRHDLETNLDKRLQLDVRVQRLEERVLV